MNWMEKFSTKATQWTGSAHAFLFANLILVIWLIAGPFTGFSDTWQLVINTLTTLVTFDMVFLIQRSQNKDSLVLQTKLNELLAATRASNRLIDIEDLSEEEVRRLHDRYETLAQMEANDENCRRRTSIEQIPTT